MQLNRSCGKQLCTGTQCTQRAAAKDSMSQDSTREGAIPSAVSSTFKAERSRDRWLEVEKKMSFCYVFDSKLCFGARSFITSGRQRHLRRTECAAALGDSLANRPPSRLVRSLNLLVKFNKVRPTWDKTATLSAEVTANNSLPFPSKTLIFRELSGAPVKNT